MLEPLRKPLPESETTQDPWIRVDEGRMRSVALMVEQRLRFGHRSEHVTLVHDFSDLIDRYGKQTAEQLVQPVKDEIVRWGWIPCDEIHSIKGHVRLQVVARRPHDLAPEKSS